MQSRSRLVRLGVFAFHCWTAIIVTTLITLGLGAFVEHFTGESIGDVIFGGPCFIAFLAVGFCLGFWINRWLKSKLAKWVWVRALALWCVFLQDQIRMPGPQGVLHSIWTNYFGNSNCGGTECVYELVGTWPLFSSIGYSIGSFVGCRKKQDYALVSKSDSALSISQSQSEDSST